MRPPPAPASLALRAFPERGATAPAWPPSSWLAWVSGRSVYHRGVTSGPPGHHTSGALGRGRTYATAPAAQLVTSASGPHPGAHIRARRLYRPGASVTKPCFVQCSLARPLTQNGPFCAIAPQTPPNPPCAYAPLPLARSAPAVCPRGAGAIMRVVCWARRPIRLQWR